MVKKFIVILFVFWGLLGFYFFVTAETIDSTYKYAWGNYAGWINFSASNGNVEVTGTRLTGHIWSENLGWINLAPTHSGVVNNGSGILSGYAWCENGGWINFEGVSIGCSGKFIGSANFSDTSFGEITFDCANCNVVTDWRAPVCVNTPTGTVATSFCGDSFCGWQENCDSCSQDCGVCKPVCGDANCNGDETCANCQSDCGKCAPTCKDGKCENPEDCSTCADDCGICKLPPSCGDNTCTGDETCTNCPSDCGICQPTCGDKTCTGDESCTTCLQDCGECPEEMCGDNTCNKDETCGNCQVDCGQCQLACGDGLCNENETCQSCSQDCGVCAPQPTCGDKTCNGNESCESCADDCGTCQQIIPFVSGNGIIEKTAEKIVIEIGKITKQATETINTVVMATKKIVELPEMAVATKVVSTIGVVSGIGLIVLAVMAAASAGGGIAIPLNILSLLLTGLGIRKKNLSWGIVYDSTTKKPLRFVHLSLIDTNGKIISSMTTDGSGRYGFFTNPGIYQIAVKKPKYIFPSQKLLGKINDEVYDNLYFGEQIQIINPADKITKNIPLDFTGLYKSKILNQLSKIFNILFILGFIVAAIIFFVSPSIYNNVIFYTYLALILLRILRFKTK